MAAQHFEHRRACNLLLVEDALEHWRFKNAEPDPQPYPDHNDAEPERHPPTPSEELIAGNRAEDQYRDIGDEETRRAAPLRPRGDEAGMCVGLCPLHRDQRGTTPFAANADPLDKAD